ncbi:MAG: hypothetical protein J6T56_00240 [Bacteroidales bacterium]|nr:hypothetical protein [Bacteroidales bacterium]
MGEGDSASAPKGEKMSVAGHLNNNNGKNKNSAHNGNGYPRRRDVFRGLREGKEDGGKQIFNFESLVRRQGSTPLRRGHVVKK